jgi:hypothetical protein
MLCSAESLSAITEEIGMLLDEPRAGAPRAA